MCPSTLYTQPSPPQSRSAAIRHAADMDKVCASTAYLIRGAIMRPIIVERNRSAAIRHAADMDKVCASTAYLMRGALMRPIIVERNRSAAICQAADLSGCATESSNRANKAKD